MTEKNLKENFEYVTNHKEELLREYNNKFILVFDKKVVGSFDTYENAAAEGIRLYGIEANFLVHQVVENEPLNFVMEALL